MLLVMQELPDISKLPFLLTHTPPPLVAVLASFASVPPMVPPVILKVLLLPITYTPPPFSVALLPVMEGMFWPSADADMVNLPQSTHTPPPL